ncbi:hypothetical protein DTL42_09450 [Bremerella cremea]|uniref:Uncharacterized protein n=1 Tax=Bremerella cremea TaxID=1031537 RepID=A0A368KTM2_9BACT|nr:hypothetical protein DTL42_09450 [Bremerella cremea]
MGAFVGQKERREAIEKLTVIEVYFFSVNLAQRWHDQSGIEMRRLSLENEVCKGYWASLIGYLTGLFAIVGLFAVVILHLWGMRAKCGTRKGFGKLLLALSWGFGKNGG